MHHFLVIIAYLFHGTHGTFKMPIAASDAEHAARMGFHLADEVGCLYNGQVTHCIKTTSVRVLVERR
jgi:hypothetical protein